MLCLDPERFKKLQEACRIHFHLVASPKTAEVPSYDQKTTTVDEYWINEYEKFERKGLQRDFKGTYREFRFKIFSENSILQFSTWIPAFRQLEPVVGRKSADLAAW